MFVRVPIGSTSFRRAGDVNQYAVRVDVRVAFARREMREPSGDDVRWLRFVDAAGTLAHGDEVLRRQ